MPSKHAPQLAELSIGGDYCDYFVHNFCRLSRYLYHIETNFNFFPQREHDELGPWSSRGDQSQATEVDSSLKQCRNHTSQHHLIDWGSSFLAEIYLAGISAFLISCFS